MRNERPVSPSVLDRLIDMDPKLGEDASVGRGQSVRELKASLQRDLEWLFNTRRVVDEVPGGAEHLQNSLYYYGLPEFREMTVSAAGDVLSQQIEAALKRFEPRLSNVRVVMRSAEGPGQVAHFVIEAILLIDPLPERIAFDTVLATKGEYRVRGES
jgi:type VI secretion system protein ImpF